MRDVHTIRLRGPWQLEPLVRYVPAGDGRFKRCMEKLPAATKATMPADWSAAFGDDFSGQVRYTRRFHEPSGLEDLEEVWLAVEPPHSHALIHLNGHALGEARFSGPGGPGEPVRFDVTHLLREANTLEIIVTHPELDAAGRPIDDSQRHTRGGLTGEVRLEIGFPD